MGSLEFVSMPQNGINPPGITALAHAFAFNTKLKHINLCDNTFTVTGALAMAEVWNITNYALMFFNHDLDQLFVQMVCFII